MHSAAVRMMTAVDASNCVGHEQRYEAALPYRNVGAPTTLAVRMPHYRFEFEQRFFIMVTAAAREHLDSCRGKGGNA